MKAITDTKQALRTEKLAQRLAMSKEDRADKSAQIIKHLSPLIEGKTVGLYYPIKKEVDIRGLQNPLSYFPRTEGNICKYYKANWDDLKPGAYGILEPQQTTPINPEIILVPGIVFSKTLNRIGFGHGYFDRTLKEQSGIKIGLCYEFQLADFKPSPWDVQMNIVVTEKGIYT